MTQAEVNAYEARFLRQLPRGAEGPAEKESELHKQIIDYCKNQGWIAFYGSMAHHTYRTPGEPDFTILMDGGRTVMIECKTNTGKLSPDQRAIKAWANRLGHEIHVVRDFPSFAAIVRKN